jgi:Reverse transcriptase (RNA-dependent DNA polymerase)
MIKRDVYLIPPRGFAAHGMRWKLLKPVYGLVSAPKAWYDRLCAVVQKHGFTSDLSDEAIFRLRDLVFWRYTLTIPVAEVLPYSML